MSHECIVSWVHGLGCGGAAILPPGFSVNWQQNQATMFHRLMGTNFVYDILAICLYLSLSVKFNIASFQIYWLKRTTDTKHTNEMLWNFTCSNQITHDKNRKIANQYFEFEYHFSTLPKILITFEQGCTVIAAYLSSIAFDALSISSKVANSVEWSFLNPYWFYWDRLFSIK